MVIDYLLFQRRTFYSSRDQHCQASSAGGFINKELTMMLTPLMSSVSRKTEMDFLAHVKFIWECMNEWRPSWQYAGIWQIKRSTCVFLFFSLCFPQDWRFVENMELDGELADQLARKLGVLEEEVRWNTNTQIQTKTYKNKYTNTNTNIQTQTFNSHTASCNLEILKILTKY